MSQKVIVDSSAWISLLLNNDQNHLRIEKTFKSIRKYNTHLFTSNDIIDETVTFLVYHHPKSLVTKFSALLNTSLIQGSLSQLWVDEILQQEAIGTVKKYLDQKLSLTDATTIELMKRFKLDYVLTLDSDFRNCSIPTFELDT